jgi:hypothetical protein
MTDPILEDNLRRLLHRCTPRLSEDDLDQALARFEGRRKPALLQGRILAAVAALFLVGLLGWLAVSSPVRPTAPAAQESPEDVARLIGELGSPTPDVREKAKRRLLALGTAALGPLDRALYHEDPEVRIQSQALAKIVRRADDIHVPLAFVRAAVKIVRARWTARDFTDFQKTVDDAFDPLLPSTIHYVPRKTVDSAFDVARDPGSSNPRMKTIRGAKDSLTAAMVAALDQDPGILFLDAGGQPTDLDEVVVFTLPDKVGWSAYVVVSLGEFEEPGFNLRSWVCVEGDAKTFFQSVGLSPRAGGGVTMSDVDPKSFFMPGAFKKGDVVRALNGTPVDSPADLLRLVDQPPGKGMTFTVDRDGKVFSWTAKVIQRTIVKNLDAEAKKMFEDAERVRSENPERAAELYRRLLNEYGKTDFISKVRKAFIEERLADIQERKK